MTDQEQRLISEFASKANQLINTTKAIDKRLTDDIDNLTRQLMEKDKEIETLKSQLSEYINKEEEQRKKLQDIDNSDHEFFKHVHDKRWLNFKKDLIIKKGGRCECCGGGSSLIVTVDGLNKYYKPWDYPEDRYHVKCFNCIEKETPKTVSP